MTISCSTTANPFTMRYTLPFVNRNATEFQRRVNKEQQSVHTIDAALLKVPASSDSKLSPMEP